MKPCPPQRRRARLLLFLALAAAAPPAGAARADAPPGAAPGELLVEADRRALAARREWRTLLHVKRGLLGERSLVDDPRFFLDPGGKADPGAELRATLAAMFAPAAAGDAHALCRFPARTAWLREALALPDAALPAPDCAAYRAYLAEVDPRAVTLVFPVGYSNSPATMYGHTLLRVDSGAASGLLATAVSYAARTDASFGPLFALKGLFGLYDGYYFVNRYYEKITEYSHIESRDIWEYALDLTPAEALRLTRHLWELKDLGSRYYFFDENCASNLLLLLEAARPGLELEDGSTLWAIPVDTVRRVLAAGIVTGAAWRPSRATRLRTIAAPLPPPALDLAAAIARGEEPPAAALGDRVAPGDRARVLDAAAELHQAAFFERRLPRRDYAARLIDILGARSGLEGPAYAFPEPPRPEEGHRTFLLGAGAAVLDGEGALALRARPVYHGLLDPRRGFQEGAAISFGDTSALLGEGGAARLERFGIVDILSLAPIGRFAQPVSWKVGVGFEREERGEERARTPFAVTWGGGWTLAPHPRLFLYALPGIEARAGGAVGSGGVAGGLGIGAGALWMPAPRWTLHLAGNGHALLVGEESERWRASLGQAVALGRNDALELTVSAEGSGGEARLGARLLWNRFL